MPEQRPRVRIRFRYNVDTGEIEEFIIDDQAPAASEAYHDKVAHTIAARLAREPNIADAGRLRGAVRQRQATPDQDFEPEQERPALDSTSST